MCLVVSTHLRTPLVWCLSACAQTRDFVYSTTWATLCKVAFVVVLAMIIVPTPSLPSCQRFVAEHALTGLKFTRIIGVWQGFFERFLQKILFLMSTRSAACRSSLEIRGVRMLISNLLRYTRELSLTSHVAIARQLCFSLTTLCTTMSSRF